MYRFQLRRSALRVLSSSPSSYLAKPRTLTTLSSSLRVPRQSTVAVFQRRWVTGEAEVKKEDEETPISEIQPTPQEEVENAIQSDNASESPADAQVQASESATSNTVQSDAPEAQSAVDSAVNSVSEATSRATDTIKETARGMAESATGAFASPSRQAREGSLIPKPTIYIGNLFFDVTENDLVKELARFGTITKCRLMRDSRGLSKGSVQNVSRKIAHLNANIFPVSVMSTSKLLKPLPRPSKLFTNSCSKAAASPFNMLPSSPPSSRPALIAPISPSTPLQRPFSSATCLSK